MMNKSIFSQNATIGIAVFSYYFKANVSGTTLTTNENENWLTIEKVG